MLSQCTVATAAGQSISKILVKIFMEPPIGLSGHTVM